jgi:antitoxin component HigA of HigAB toxin-antitoxin module
MDIRPIKNERDYRRVMKEVDSLMDAKANTPTGDRLDVLVTLAEAWEEKALPNRRARPDRGHSVCDGTTRAKPARP